MCGSQSCPRRTSTSFAESGLFRGHPYPDRLRSSISASPQTRRPMCCVPSVASRLMHRLNAGCGRPMGLLYISHAPSAQPSRRGQCHAGSAGQCNALAANVRHRVVRAARHVAPPLVVLPRPRSLRVLAWTASFVAKGATP
jgi:hypothetical protein